jgi:hypothetical protein
MREPIRRDIVKIAREEQRQEIVDELFDFSTRGEIRTLKMVDVAMFSVRIEDSRDDARESALGRAHARTIAPTRAELVRTSAILPKFAVRRF